MNVLVYNGPGVSKTSLAHTLSTLRTLLLPNYAVQTITPRSLTSDPWHTNCALLVLPGGRDLPYVAELKQANDKIVNYVQGGGSYLGLCAGAYYACRSVEWEVGSEQEVTGPRPLRFFNGIGRGCTYPGFQYETENGARAVRLLVSSASSGPDQQLDGLYYNGGGEFVDAEFIPNTSIIARYMEGYAAEKVAAVHCKVGNGSAVLWSIHPEYPLTLEPAISAIRRTKPDLENRIEEYEKSRWDLMKHSLDLLGLQVPILNDIRTLRPLPQFITSTSGSTSAIVGFLDNLTKELVDSEPIVLKDNADTFHFYKDPYSSELFNRIQNPPESDVSISNTPARSVIILKDCDKLPAEATRNFNISQYFADLTVSQNERRLPPTRSQKLGEVLLYGEVVTSTQTMLDKQLLSHLPIPLLSLATHQLAGRGRGSNTWLSPPGCLQFSLLLRLPLTSFPASKLVFIQYLFGLAVIEACRSPSVLGAFGDRVRLKWPNDIYAVTGHAGPKKIGGILVNTSFMGGHVDIVIGCGLNVLSPSPLTSLTQLIPPGLPDFTLTMERTAAVIMSTFDEMWSRFSSSASFEPFMDLYLDRWLHSDQVVQLTTVDPPTTVRIVGITPDHGLLRTIPTESSKGYYRSHRGEEYIDLQPDGNSFDLMAGLIKAKS
ncbi:class II aaRS and biotin synthetase [Fomitiporia mediterranea MF3/22]|uniref:class II aaRS and biotin synthetase n=1 Tax=Fomitiporia mediterranea (strain MF3/22) TaxID=694068 RepID=UPI0004407A5D|nr:class II aaRS and biotin synthetase [Fomitiporia mediterranea MF3/22]EJD07395.1 class II aaRS and biotin synthetase [Fomitiporia mediterranea MF3/22]